MSTSLLSKKFFLWVAPALAVAAAPTASTLATDGVADSPATATTVTPHSTDEAGPLEAQHRLATFKTWIIEHPEFAAAGYMEQINWADESRVTALWDADRWADTAIVREELTQEALRRSIKLDFQQRTHGLNDLREISGEILDQAESLSLIGFDLEAVSTLRVDNGPVELIGSFVEPAPVAQRGDLASLAGANGAQSVEDVERIVREAVGVEVKVVEGGATPAGSRAADTIGPSFDATLVTS